MEAPLQGGGGFKPSAMQRPPLPPCCCCCCSPRAWFSVASFLARPLRLALLLPSNGRAGDIDSVMYTIAAAAAACWSAGRGCAATWTGGVSDPPLRAPRPRSSSRLSFCTLGPDQALRSSSSSSSLTSEETCRGAPAAAASPAHPRPVPDAARRLGAPPPTGCC